MNEEKEYYNGEKLLSKLDLDGNVPEIYVCDGTKTAGKTFFFKSLQVERFLKNKSKFAIITRTQGDAKAVHKSFMEDLVEKFHGYSMEAKEEGKGKVSRIYLMNEELKVKETCAFAIPLSSLEYIKRNSSMFNDIESLFFDEFQRQDGRYDANEVFNLMNIHRAIARGYNVQQRHVPIYLVGNSIDLYNPYYIKMGICQRLQKDTHFLRGNGWVMEHTINTKAAEAIMNSGVTKALGSDEESQDALLGQKYLNSPSLIVKTKPASAQKLCSIVDDSSIDLWFSNQMGTPMLYVSDYVKGTDVPVYCYRVSKLDENVIYMPSNIRRTIIRFMRGGNIRFIGGKSKDSFFKLIDKL